MDKVKICKSERALFLLCFGLPWLIIQKHCKHCSIGMCTFSSENNGPQWASVAKGTKLLKIRLYTPHVHHVAARRVNAGDKIAKVLFGIDGICDFHQSFLSFLQASGVKKRAAERSEMDTLMKKIHLSEAVLFTCAKVHWNLSWGKPTKEEFRAPQWIKCTDTRNVDFCTVNCI